MSEQLAATLDSPAPRQVVACEGALNDGRSVLTFRNHYRRYGIRVPQGGHRAEAQFQPSSTAARTPPAR